MWRETLESKGFRLSRTKTEYMRCDFGGVVQEEGDVSLKGQVVPKKNTVGAKSDQLVNICRFTVRCDWMWPSTR